MASSGPMLHPVGYTDALHPGEVYKGFAYGWQTLADSSAIDAGHAVGLGLGINADRSLMTQQETIAAYNAGAAAGNNAFADRVVGPLVLATIAAFTGEAIGGAFAGAEAGGSAGGTAGGTAGATEGGSSFAFTSASDLGDFGVDASSSSAAAGASSSSAVVLGGGSDAISPELGDQIGSGWENAVGTSAQQNATLAASNSSLSLSDAFSFTSKAGSLVSTIAHFLTKPQLALPAGQAPGAGGLNLFLGQGATPAGQFTGLGASSPAAQGLLDSSVGLQLGLGIAIAIALVWFLRKVRG